jgi:hypothetical protein
VCNLPYSEKPFISRIVLSLMDRVWLNVYDIEDYTTFSLTDTLAVLSWPKNWTIKNVSRNFVFNFMPLLHKLFGQNISLSGSADI